MTKWHILIAPDRDSYPDATCIELFAGGGGSAIGLHNAGLHAIYLNEFQRDAVATLEANRALIGGDMPVIDPSDVRTVDFSGMSARVVWASTPCQAFSYAGKRRGMEDTRGTLFYDALRCVTAVRPDAIAIENVPGLASHDHGRTLDTMLSALSETGYRCAWRVLDASALDVPQRRKRVIILGVPSGSGRPIVFPKPSVKSPMTLREALDGVPESDFTPYSDRKRQVLSLVPEGGNWRDLPDTVAREYLGGALERKAGGMTGYARRLAWDEPALTMLCSPSQKQTERCHPTETRPLTVRECARVQTFPDEWEPRGSLASRYRQVGNAVPCNLAYHVGRCLLAMLGDIPVDGGTMELADSATDN